MKSILAVLICIALAGCEMCREHRGACAVALGVAVVSAALCAGGKKEDDRRVIIVAPPRQ